MLGGKRKWSNSTEQLGCGKPRVRSNHSEERVATELPRTLGGSSIDVYMDDDTLFSDYLRTVSQSAVDVDLVQERDGN
jgi:hypothetical protein